MAWNGSGSAATSAATNKKIARPRKASSGVPISGAFKGALALILILAIGAGSYWYVINTLPKAKEPTEEKTEKKMIAEVEADIAEPEQGCHVNKSEDSEKLPKANFEDPEHPYVDGRKVISSRTNSWDQIVDICIMPDGRRRKVIRNAKLPVFTNVSDQTLAVALSGDMNEDIPPMPICDNLEEAFVESLKTPIEINDDDSEAIKESKRRVIEARAVIDAEMKKGRGYREILEEHLAQRKMNAEARETVMQAAQELRNSGDTEMLNEYLQQANGFLRDNGIGEVETPFNHKRNK